ncbi:TPA: hypothetical protein ACTXAV_003333 [Raoultella planticola]|uniref:hypothetical protein n=1 Tax=Raoultella planticola TaxID=575 RepID=UPI00294628EA|nr:hypothetical protein [Raoultella planticola]HED2415504.1 hypothetical protein [Raoultella planticola]HEH6361192.1 hypothetical protein [Raoultella planticola]
MVHITNEKLSAKERVGKKISNKIFVCFWTYLILESVGDIIYDPYHNTLLSELIVVFCFVSGFFSVCFFIKLILINNRLRKKEGRREERREKREKEVPHSVGEIIELWGNVFMSAGMLLYSMILVFKIIVSWGVK